jgi:hypothetical protein
MGGATKEELCGQNILFAVTKTRNTTVRLSTELADSWSALAHIPLPLN